MMVIAQKRKKKQSKFIVHHLIKIVDTNNS